MQASMTMIFLFSILTSASFKPIFNILTVDKYDGFGYTALSVANMSLEKVHEMYGQFFGINYTFISAGERCSPKGKMTAIADARYSTGIDVLVGPVCESDLEIAAYMASSWNIPILYPSGSSPRVSNKAVFSTLISIGYTMQSFADFYTHIFKFYNWRNIALIYEKDRPSFQLLATSLNDVFKKENYSTTMFPVHGRVVAMALKEASKHSRVFVAICSENEFRKIMLTAHSLDMTDGTYVYLFIRFYDEVDFWELGDQHEKVVQAVYDSVFILQPGRSAGEEFNKFVEIAKIKALTEFNHTLKDNEVGNYAATLYDSILIYAQIINETLAEGGNIKDGQNITNRIKGRTFKGLNGDIFIDNNGDREPHLQLLDMDMMTGEYVVVADYFSVSRSLVFLNDVFIHWPSENGPPRDTPHCGFLGDNGDCKTHDINTIVIVVCLLLIATSGCVVGIVFIYRKIKHESDLNSQWWNIKKEDLKFSSKFEGSKRSKYSMLMSTDEMRSYMFDANSTTEFMSANKKYAYYKGNSVSVVKTNIDHLTITRQLQKEFKQMKDIQRNNLVQFIGLYRTYKGIYVVVEHCTRGSLQDILQNDSLMLDWDFKAALLTDLTNGMNYLHDSTILVHGRLNSDRCLIDSRFGLKVSDYGLPSIYGTDPLRSVENEREYLWFAPECLRGNKVSQASDVYSFGIILYEILTRMSPFETETDNKTIHDIVNEIKEKRAKPLRPSIPPIVDQPKVLDLMKSCWDEIFFRRPTFKSIKRQLKEISGSRSINILDALLRRMEQYANNLEELVGQRTEAFLEEKKKSDILLEQLLPKAVADKLKNNQLVDPEAYESVTIYFSDIVGFTILSAQSSPMEVVDLLNDLYCVFDAIIERYNVYKVETIGDAYMVVSGLPTRNGNKHASEIALMSLDIVQNVSEFRVRHLPDERLKARIGIHSGPVCAGVVGTKMPRYCLFGDTVNTASRMESHGEAMKIHVTSDTYNLLKNDGNFQLEQRGTVDIKGKGLMVTYWLVGAKNILQKQSVVGNAAVGGSQNIGVATEMVSDYNHGKSVGNFEDLLFSNDTLLIESESNTSTPKIIINSSFN